jgi:hypothetical protein
MKKKIYDAIDKLLKSISDNAVGSHILMDIQYKFREAEECKFVRDDAEVAVTVTLADDPKQATTLLTVEGPFYMAPGELLAKKGATWCVGPFSMKDVKGSG